MPRGDGTGPVGGGARDGRGRRLGGRGQSSSQRGSGAMTGGRGGRVQSSSQGESGAMTGGRGGSQSFPGSQSQGGFFNRVGNFFRQFNSRRMR